MATDAKRKVINVNIILYGPSGAGKTSNIQFIHRIIHRKLKPDQRGQVSTLCQDGYPDVSYEFLPIELGELKGIETNLYIYSAPSGEDGLETRLNLLNEAAGVVFIVDSHPERVEDNMESLANLKEELQWWDIEYDSFPVVIQYNKRDLPEVATIEELESQLNPEGKPSFQAVASAGQGVRDTFALVSKMAVRRARLQLIARERAARAGEGAQKVRDEVEAAQFARDRAQGATAESPAPPAEVTLETEPPPRTGEDSIQGETDDSEELVHETQREVGEPPSQPESGAAEVAGSAGGPEGETEPGPPRRPEGVGEPEQPLEETRPLTEEPEADAAPPPAKKQRKRRGARKHSRGATPSPVAPPDGEGEEPASEESEPAPEPIAEPGVPGDEPVLEPGVAAAEAAPGASGDAESETGEQEAGDVAVAAEPVSAGEPGSGDEPEDEAGAMQPPDEEPDADAVAAQDAGGEGTGDEAGEAVEAAAEPEQDVEPDSADSVPRDMDEPGEDVATGDDFLKTSFSFGDADMPYAVDSLEAEEAVLAVETDEVDVIAVGAEEDEGLEEEFDGEEPDYEPGSEEEEETTHPLALSEGPSLASIPLVPGLTGEPDIKIQTYADDEEEDDGPVIRLGSRLLEEEELQLDDDMLLEETEEELGEELELADGEAAELEAAPGDHPEHIEEEPPPPPVMDLDVSIEPDGGAGHEVEPSAAQEQAADTGGIVEPSAAPEQALEPEVAFVEESVPSDALTALEDTSGRDDGGPVAAPSESTLDLPEEAVDLTVEEGGAGGEALLEGTGVPDDIELEVPGDREAPQDEAGDGEPAALEEEVVPDEAAEPTAGEEARLTPPDDEAVFESIVEEPVDERAPTELEAEAESYIEEELAEPIPDTASAGEAARAATPQVVAWGEATRVDAATIQLPVVVRLPGREDEVTLAVTIHVDELTKA